MCQIDNRPTGLEQAIEEEISTMRRTLIIAALLILALSAIAACARPTPRPIPPPKPIPTLTELSFLLSEESAESYNNYIPIYIRYHQTLHLNWRITKGSDSIYISFTTPNGRPIGMKKDGDFNDYWPTPTTTCERLGGMGNIIFSPSQRDWGEGYYYFNPRIGWGEPPTSIEVAYWIED